MRPERSAVAHFAGVIGSLWLVAALLAPATSLAVSEDVRSLLRELSIQVPSREVGAPPFVLPDVKGASVRLADYKGRAVMIYFWTTY
jgi:cytochrome oxidase Cu insertion factor (SCO1/SenC/PrrC family)